MSKLSSAGLIFLHLIGKIEDDYIYTYEINSYKNAFNFYETSKSMLIASDQLELFAILGESNKVEKISKQIENQINDNVQNILNHKNTNNIDINLNNVDKLTNEFNQLIQEKIFQKDKIMYPLKSTYVFDGWTLYCFNILEKPNINSAFYDELINTWINREQPFMLGKQITTNSFELENLKGRKIIDIISSNKNDFSIILEGGYKLNNNLNSFRTKMDVKNFNVFTTNEVDSIICNPVYSYKEFLYPSEIYEEWHKIFMYAVSLLKDLTKEELINKFKTFLEFIKTNICNKIDAEAIVEKEKFHKCLYINYKNIKNFLKGKEEQVISKELLTLLNTRYIYLPYIYDIIGLPTKKQIKFNKETFKQKMKLSDINNSYKKGLNFEKVGEYFISCIEGLKITGKRIKTGFQEIDLSAINISTDHNMWKLGAYILIECKNTKNKIGIQTIRNLSHISDLKGNKTTILISTSDLTKDAKKEINRIILNGKYIICITKKDLDKLTNNNDCYNLVINKFNDLENYNNSTMKI